MTESFECDQTPYKRLPSAEWFLYGRTDYLRTVRPSINMLEAPISDRLLAVVVGPNSVVLNWHSGRLAAVILWRKWY